MPDTPIRLSPHICPKCGAASWYIVQLPILEETVDLAWFCRDCHHEWPVTRRDVGETTPRQFTRLTGSVPARGGRR